MGTENPERKEKIKLVVEGDPIAKKRPRFFVRGKHAKAYNSQQTEEGRFMWCLKSQLDANGFIPFQGPVRVYLLYVFGRPKAHYGTGKNAGKLKSSAPDYCLNQKDVDNLSKFTLDCMNKLAFDDDRQVIELAAKKEYGEQPRTEIYLEEV